MTKDLVVKQINEEATEILTEILEIKKTYKDKHLITSELFSDILVVIPVVIIALRSYMLNYGYELSETNMANFIAIIAFYVSYLGSVYLPLRSQQMKKYSFSYKVKDKVNANKLIVALNNVKVKGVGVAQINTIYNGKDMYLDIKYKI